MAGREGGDRVTAQPVDGAVAVSRVQVKRRGPRRIRDAAREAEGLALDSLNGRGGQRERDRVDVGCIDRARGGPRVAEVVGRRETDRIRTGSRGREGDLVAG